MRDDETNDADVEEVEQQIRIVMELLRGDDGVPDSRTSDL